jgi:hypothetical protein
MGISVVYRFIVSLMVYDQAAWIAVSSYLRNRIGVPHDAADVMRTVDTSIAYPGTLTDSGFFFLASKLSMAAASASDVWFKTRIQNSLGLLSMNEGFAILFEYLNSEVRTFMAMDDNEKDEWQIKFVNACLAPLLDQHHDLDGIPGIPDKRDMSRTGEYIVQSPLFPVEYFESAFIREGLLRGIKAPLGPEPMSHGDLIETLTSFATKVSVGLLAFSVFTTVHRYAELLTEYWLFLEYEEIRESSGVKMQRSPFGTGLRYGLGTNLGKGGEITQVKHASMLSTFTTFIETNPVILAQFLNVLPSSMRLKELEENLNARYEKLSNDGAPGADLFRAFKGSKNIDKIRLTPDCINLLVVDAHVSEFLAFVHTDGGRERAKLLMSRVSKTDIGD